MDRQLMNTLNTDQQRALENIRAAVDRLWSRPLHRYFTDHTVAHSQRVIALLDGLTTGMMTTEKRLSPTEVFILLAAAYLHDIGMQNEKFAGGDSSTSSEQRLDEIRAHHNEQTAEMIYAVFEDPANAFSIPLARDPGIVEAVALVAKGHRKVDLHSAEYDPLIHGDETLRLRLLAALLRFGDELDIDHRRVDIEQMKLLALPPNSQLHWYKCHYVSGVSIVDEYIRIVYRFPQDRPNYESLIVPLVERDVRAKHAALEEIFRANGVKVALGPSQIRLMRLLQPLPPEVEALARGGGATETGFRYAQGDEPSPAAPRPSQATPPLTPTAKSVEPSPRPASVVFYQPDQRFDQQVNVAGDYVDRRTTTSARPAPRSESQDGADWDTAIVRELLTAAFSDEKLTALCFDHFRPVHEDFGSEMSKGQKIQRLLDHCMRHDQLDVLLRLVEERNPDKYARFAPRLRRAPSSGKGTSRATGVAASAHGRDVHPHLTPPTPSPRPIHDRWALLVGINRYIDPAFTSLNFCVNDVLTLEVTLKDRGYTVVTLHDDTEQEHLFPTRENVEAELVRICQAARPDDLLWVHFACHGKLVDGQPVFVTYETRLPTLAKKALPLAEVERQMRNSVARRLVLTLDACHTGVEIGRDIGTADPEFIRHAYELAEGFALIAASTAQQVAQEWREKAHGVFTYYLLDGLSGQADRSGKGFVTVDDLKTHVLDGLRHWNVEHGGLLQEPTARTEGLGDIILADHRDK